MRFRPASVRWCQLLAHAAPAAVGAIFLFSALAKAARPAPMRLVLGHVLSRAGLGDAGIRVYPFIIVLVIFEIGLGGWLLVGAAPRAARRTALLTLLLFSAFLVALAMDPAAPPCACLGGILFAADARTGNLLSLGKNLMLIALLVWSGAAAAARRADTSTRDADDPPAPTPTSPASLR